MTVIKRVENNKYKRSRFLCLCECGKEKIIDSSELQRGSTKSCGCIRKEFDDLTGRIFGKLTVINYVKTEKRITYFLCKCECGNEVIVRGRDLKSKNTNSCGCLKYIGVKIGYGESAFNALFKSYKYGAKKRGLEFTLSKDEFKELVLRNCYYCGREPYQERRNKFNGNFMYTGIDRIDNSKGYVKDNIRPCCWQCNVIKHKHNAEDFLNTVKDIYEHMELWKLNS